jgi:tetratricopeptide (TPR) repeat protein
MAKPAKTDKAAPAAKRRAPSAAVAVRPSPAMPAWITAAFLFAAAAILGFIVYARALNGDFVFDDRTLPMFYADAATYPFRFWLGTRPLLMVSYYFNYHTSGLDSFAYHAWNVVMHAGCTVLLFFAVKRILEYAKIAESQRSLAAMFGAGLFLLHPVQTEAVSYVASRSENMSVLFFLAAFAIFLYRRKVAVTAPVAVAILFLYLCAITSKEHTAVLPAVLLLTDYFFNPGFSFSGIRRNWKLYAPITVGAAAGAVFIVRHISGGSNLGFGLKDFTWYQYLFTQFRAFFVYLRLFLFPIHQSVDYDFPVSHTILEHGALFYGLALLGLIAAAGYYRKRFPVACYGFFLTLILFAPTSSFVPIRDPLAERRLYLPFIGLVLMVCDLVVRLPWPRRAAIAVLTGICVLLAAVTFQRNAVWKDMQSLWQDAYDKNPDNPRALMGLGDGYAFKGQCAEAIPYFEKAVKLRRDYRGVYNLASAYDCANRLPDALAGYQGALQIRQTAEAWTHLALIDMKDNQFDRAFQALSMAQQRDTGYLLTYNYRGILDLALARFDEAAQQFQFVLARDPSDQTALRGIDLARRHVRQF